MAPTSHSARRRLKLEVKRLYGSVDTAPARLLTLQALAILARVEAIQAQEYSAAPPGLPSTPLAPRDTEMDD